MNMIENRIEFGDCRETMRKWAAEGVKVQTCVTSPPYYGLRDYGHEGQIGLEQTPEEYISNMVEVFSCVKDILADDGTLWVNIGDSYAGYHGNKNTSYEDAPSNKGGYFENQRKTLVNHNDIKNKDLIGIPWMLAFALRADGWYLRQEIIWHKPNPMPESVTDRCTKAHEQIFLLSKSPKYFFDNEAIKEPLADTSIGRADRKQRLIDKTGIGTLGKQIVDGVDSTHAYAGLAMGRNGKTGYDLESGLRNKRSVWTVATKPYKGAHFATYPTTLIDPMILAGSKIGDTIFDPFMGSGTTAQVALQHGRKYLGCELNKEYEPLQQQRIAEATAGKPDAEVIDNLFDGL
jgi:DNA modification methylase